MNKNTVIVFLGNRHFGGFFFCVNFNNIALFIMICIINNRVVQPFSDTRVLRLLVRKEGKTMIDKIIMLLVALTTLVVALNLFMK